MFWHQFSHEAMTDLIAVMGTLVDSQGRILIEGVYDEVAPLLPEEEALYKNITFDTVRWMPLSSSLEKIRSLIYFFRKPIVPKRVLKKPFKIAKKKFSCIVGDIHPYLYMEFKVDQTRFFRRCDTHRHWFQVHSMVMAVKQLFHVMSLANFLFVLFPTCKFLPWKN